MSATPNPFLVELDGDPRVNAAGRRGYVPNVVKHGDHVARRGAYERLERLRGTGRSGERDSAIRAAAMTGLSPCSIAEALGTSEAYARVLVRQARRTVPHKVHDSSLAHAARTERIAIAKLRVQGLSLRAIAALLGISSGAVYQKLVRHRRYVEGGIDPQTLPRGFDGRTAPGSDDALGDEDTVATLRRAHAEAARLNRARLEKRRPSSESDED